MTAQANISEARLATLEETIADMARSVPGKSKKADSFKALQRIIRAVEGSQAFVAHADMSEVACDRLAVLMPIRQ